jgi:hypothetical protein
MTNSNSISAIQSSACFTMATVHHHEYIYYNSDLEGVSILFMQYFAC